MNKAKFFNASIIFIWALFLVLMIYYEVNKPEANSPLDKLRKASIGITVILSLFLLQHFWPKPHSKSRFTTRIGQDRDK